MTTYSQPNFVPLAQSLRHPKPSTETFESVLDKLAEAQVLKADNRKLEARSII